jgi:aspartate/methionine/tyrosine aminotransferase
MRFSGSIFSPWTISRFRKENIFLLWKRRWSNIKFPDFVKQLVEKAKVAVMLGTAFCMHALGEKNMFESPSPTPRKRFQKPWDMVQRLVRQIMKS